MLGLVLWLVAASLGAPAYDALLPLLTSVPAKILNSLAVLALIYHFGNGLRHLAWDIGLGFERGQARGSAAVVISATVLLTALCVYFVFRHGAVAP